MDAKTAETLHKFLGETAGFWIQTGAFFLSAWAAVGIIWANRRDGKRRAIIDLVIQQKQDKDLQAARRFILDLHDKNIQNFARYLENRQSDEFKNILRVLNNYEFIATGIREDALDEEIFKRMQFSVLLKDWDALCGFVMEFRKEAKRETLFQEFEYLAKRFKKKPLKRNFD